MTNVPTRLERADAWLDGRAPATPLALQLLSTPTLLRVQAAYLTIPHANRAQAVHDRIDQLAVEVSERSRPYASNLHTLYAEITRGDWKRTLRPVIT